MARSVAAVLAGFIAVAVALTRGDLGPNWYPIAIAVTAYPVSWLGGKGGSGRTRS